MAFLTLVWLSSAFYRGPELRKTKLNSNIMVTGILTYEGTHIASLIQVWFQIIGLQLFETDPNNENLTKQETPTHPLHTHRRIG